MKAITCVIDKTVDALKSIKMVLKYVDITYTYSRHTYKYLVDMYRLCNGVQERKKRKNNNTTTTTKMTGLRHAPC